MQDILLVRWLLTTLPLLATITSAIVLAFRYFPLVKAKQHGFSSNRGHSDALDKISRLAFEAAAIGVAHALVLGSWDRAPPHSINAPGWVGIISWTYLTLLLLVRSDISTSYSSYSPVWNDIDLVRHSSLLYALHWGITATVVRSIYLETDQIEWSSPLALGFAVTTLLFCSALFRPLVSVSSEATPGGHRLEKKTSILGSVTFSWLDPMIFKGIRKRLELHDIWDLTASDSSSAILADYESIALGRRGLLSTLLVYLRSEFAVQALWASMSAVLTFAPTLLMQSILRFLEHADRSDDSSAAWTYLKAMFIAGLLYAVAEGQTAWYGQKIALRLRAIVSGKVYEQLLKRAAAGGTSTTTKTDTQSRADAGTITNLVVMDSAKIADAGSNAYELWASVPVQVITASGLLFSVLGPSALAGVAMMLLMTPINGIILKHFGQAAAEATAASDMRVHETDQVLRNVRMLKLFVWESWFESKILDKRQRELDALQSRLIWWSIAATIWYAVPFVITFLSFFVFVVVQGGALTPSLAFTALSLFNALKTPLDQLVGMTARVRDSLESIRRVEKFLQEPDMIPKGSAVEASKMDQHGHALTFHKASLGWTSNVHESTLLKLDFSFLPDRLNVIAGPTGSGKSSVLMALLGEMKLTAGEVEAPKTSIAYCAQEAWLLNDTVRNNIVFTSTWNSRRYQETLEACGLSSDLAILPKGDSTIVGEKGIGLSGGQKQRVALARAVYSSCKHVLLDDCLSAVDSHTAKWLFERCITGSLMTGRTCVLATHRLALVLPKAGFVAILQQGRVISTGTPESIKNTTALLELLDSEETQARENTPAGQSAKEDYEDDRAESAKSAKADIISGTPANFVLRARPPGHIPWSVITTYAASMGGWLFWGLLFLLFASQQILAIGANWWLHKLSNAYESRIPDDDKIHHTVDPATSSVNLGYCLGVYALILLVYTMVSFGRLYVVSLGSIAASWKLHKRLLASILQAKFRFFDITTHGTLLNRFSEDIQNIDLNLMPMALGTIHFLVAMILIIIMITLLTPAFLLPGILIAAVYLIIGRLFLDSSRELKRIESEQKTPLLQQLGESLLGTVTIRAFGLCERFMQDYQRRIDSVNQPQLYLGAVDRWLAFRLNIVGTTMSFLAGYFALASGGSLSTGAVGLTLTYAISFSENVLWLVRYHALNQQNFTAVERIRDCFQIDPEAPANIPSTKPPENWPTEGAVLFKDYSARYRDELPLVLKSLNLEVKPKQRVGIVGRTGAGKSSIANAVLRSLEAEHGSIILDGIDISRIGLHDLRRAITLVPQDPTLLEGDLRSNLDPTGQFTDVFILDVLRKVRLIGAGDGVESTTSAKGSQFQNLSFKIGESGTNISLGQRQLICLARALLRSSKVVVLDEATASIDYATDLSLQRTVAELDATVITIAHRLRTVIDYDLVVVMQQGQIIQKGCPWDLMQMKGPFQDLCHDSGTFDELLNLAKAARQASES